MSDKRIDLPDWFDSEDVKTWRRTTMVEAASKAIENEAKAIGRSRWRAAVWYQID